MNMALKIALFGVGLPVLTSAVVLLGSWFMLKNDSEASVEQESEQTPSPSGRARHWGWLATLAVSLGYMTAHIGLLGLPKFAQSDAVPRLFWLLLALLALVVLEVLLQLPAVVKWLLRTALLAGAAWLMFGSMTKTGAWTQNQAAIYITSMVAGGLFFWACWQYLVSQLSTGTSTWLMMVFGIGISILLALSSSAKLAQLAGAAVAGMGVWWVLMLSGKWLKGIPSSAEGSVPAFAFLLICLCATGHFEAELTKLSVALILASPLLLLVAHKFVQLSGSWKPAILKSVAMLLPIIIAAAFTFSKGAVQKKQDDDDDDYDDDYSWSIPKPEYPSRLT